MFNKSLRSRCADVGVLLKCKAHVTLQQLQQHLNWFKSERLLNNFHKSNSVVAAAAAGAQPARQRAVGRVQRLQRLARRRVRGQLQRRRRRQLQRRPQAGRQQWCGSPEAGGSTASWGIRAGSGRQQTRHQRAAGVAAARRRRVSVAAGGEPPGGRHCWPPGDCRWYTFGSLPFSDGSCDRWCWQDPLALLLRPKPMAGATAGRQMTVCRGRGSP